jgi:bifunctional non-homologous end joining protein LigD
MKWDGYRALAQRAGRRLVLCSRTGLDLLPAFPELTPLAEALGPATVLDGEIVALDEAGRSGFSALQTRMPGPGGPASTRAWDPRRWRIAYVAFDLLRQRGHSLLERPWQERRQRLEALAAADARLTCPPWHADGGALLAAVGRFGGEGIIAKRRDSTYQPGRRSRDWIKIKLTRREEFVVGGFWLGGADRVLGSLLLGYYADADAARSGALTYAGKVGTGFDAAERARLRALCQGLAVPTSPFAGPVPARAVSWCRPQLVAEIGYAEWTHEGILRQARYAGLRPDKAAQEVVRPHPLAQAEQA